MRTAKDIVRDYLERGYGIERLRALANTREEPMRSEILGILDDRIGEAFAGDRMDQDDAVMFTVSGDEEEDAPGTAVDFSAMASKSASSDGGGIEDILVEDVGSVAIVEAVTEEKSAEPDGRGETTDKSIWSRFSQKWKGKAEPVDFDAIFSDKQNGPAGRDEAKAGLLNQIAANLGEPPKAGLDFSAAAKSASLQSDYMPGSVGLSQSEMFADASEVFGVIEEIPGSIAMEPVKAMMEEDGAEPSVETPAGGGEEMKSSAENAEADVGGKTAARAIAPAEAETAAAILCDMSPGVGKTINAGLPILYSAHGSESGDGEKLSRKERRRKQKAERKKLKKGSTNIPVEQEADAPAALPAVSGAEPARPLVLAEAPAAPNLPVAVSGPAEDAGRDAAIMVDAAVIDSVADKDASESMCAETETEGERAEEASGDDDDSGVILFNPELVLGREETDSPEGEAAPAGSFLRLLPPAAGEEDAVDAEPRKPEGESGLNGEARASILRAMTGFASSDSEPASETAAGGMDDIVVAASADPAVEEDAGQTPAALAAELEAAYRASLDEATDRLGKLQAQIDEMSARLREKDASIKYFSCRVADRDAIIAGKDSELSRLLAAEEAFRAEKATYGDMKDEHARLFGEYESLRREYNEIVTDALPNLRRDRDELERIVGKQAEDEAGLRTALKGSGRRIAVGYGLAAAAALLMVALPLAHWTSAEKAERELALATQDLMAAQARLTGVTKENDNYKKAVFELDQKSKRSKAEFDKLTKLSDRKTKELAALRAELNKPAVSANRESHNAMAGPAAPDGKLRRNEVRDPVGSIEQTLADNRRRYEIEDAQMASAVNRRNAGGAIPLNMIAPPPPDRQSSRPTRGTVQPQAPDRRETASAAAGKGQFQTATVKPGEGVAQVVYRVLGTRNQDVIDWVIHENGIRKNARGNPLIYANQQLRLPAAGKTSQAALAAPPSGRRSPGRR